jgi:hypothetical protein
MSEQKKERSRALYARDVWHVWQAVSVLWAKDCVASVTASPGLGDYRIGEWANANGPVQGIVTDADSDPAQWEFRYTSNPLTFSNGGAATVEHPIEVDDGDALGEQGLMTLRQAVEWMRENFSRLAEQCAVRAERAAVNKALGAFRATAHWSRGNVVAKKLTAVAIERLRELAITQRRKPRGPQQVDTKSRRVPKPFQMFKFNGKPALRLPQGRTPLPKAEWLRRYRERRAKQRKAPERKYRSKRKLKIPVCKFGRPLRIIRAKDIAFDHKKNGPYFETADMVSDEGFET